MTLLMTSERSDCGRTPRQHRLQVQRRFESGRSASVFLCQDLETGRSVVLKVNDRNGPALRSEWNVLASLRDAGIRVPGLLDHGSVRAADGVREAEAMLIDHVDGRAPSSAADYRLLGSSLAELARSRVTVDDPEILRRPTPAITFRTMLSEMMPYVDKDLAAACEALTLNEDETVLLHNDAAPENFLVRGASGTLVDYGSSRRGPPIFDLARACLSSELFELANDGSAFDPRWIIEGYQAAAFSRLGGLEKWFLVAGIHTFHWRTTHRGQFGVGQAIEVLRVLRARIEVGTYRCAE